MKDKKKEKLLQEFPFLTDVQKELGIPDLGTIRVRAISQSDIGEVKDLLNFDQNMTSSKIFEIEPPLNTKEAFLVNVFIVQEKDNKYIPNIVITTIYKIKEGRLPTMESKHKVYKAIFDGIELGEYIEVDNENNYIFKPSMQTNIIGAFETNSEMYLDENEIHKEKRGRYMEKRYQEKKKNRVNSVAVRIEGRYEENVIISPDKNQIAVIRLRLFDETIIDVSLIDEKIEIIRVFEDYPYMPGDKITLEIPILGGIKLVDLVLDSKGEFISKDSYLVRIKDYRGIQGKLIDEDEEEYENQDNLMYNTYVKYIQGNGTDNVIMEILIVTKWESFNIDLTITNTRIGGIGGGIFRSSSRYHGENLAMIVEWEPEILEKISQEIEKHIKRHRDIKK